MSDECEQTLVLVHNSAAIKAGLIMAAHRELEVDLFLVRDFKHIRLQLFRLAVWFGPFYRDKSQFEVRMWIWARVLNSPPNSVTMFCFESISSWPQKKCIVLLGFAEILHKIFSQ